MIKKVLGMGNAVLDILAETTDNYLLRNKLTKGSMILVDQKVSENLEKQLDFVKKDSGGSVANSMAGISMLGGEALFCGKVKNDKLGIDFQKSMEKTGTKFLCELSKTGLPTARCIVLVTPDGERTMQTFLGASTTLDEKDINESFFDDVSFLLVEGYLWSSESARSAIKKAVNFCKKRKIQVVFSLSDPGLVKMYKSDFQNFLEKDVDILIGNESEFFEIFETNENDALNKNFSNSEKFGVMTQSSKGATIFKDGQTINVKTPKVTKVVDTTGAGDMFAAGFLFKLQNHHSLESSAEFGCRVASKIISHFGARASEALKDIV